MEKARVLPNAKTAVVHALPKAGKVESIAQPPRLAVARIAKPHAIKGGAAVRKAARDDAQVKALCAATNNAPADLPASVCHPQVRIPATTGGEVRDHRTTGGTVRDHRTPSTGPTPAPR